MTQDTPSKGVCQCPHCGKKYALEISFAGRKATCKGCQNAFEIQFVQSPSPVAGATAVATAAPAHAAAAAPKPSGGTVCAICQTPIEQDQPAKVCPGCKAPYHEECWEYNKGCGVYGCSEVPPTEKLSTLEVPVSFWGKEEKNCPRCNNVILAAATRCRFCGSTFKSARPETTADYSQRAMHEMNLPKVRKFAVWLLVFSVLTCTAPIAAVVGLAWYYGNRQAIASLPGHQSAIGKIAIGLAIGQTVLIVLLAVLHAAFA